MGTSVGSVERIKNVAKIAISYVKRKYKVIVISSAMSGETNKLVKLTKKISKNFTPSEYHTIVSTGEQISCALISGQLNDQGYLARSWLGWQVPILTSGNYSSSRIINVAKKNVVNFLKKGGIPVITGFQGLNSENRITTIGRGGSDASAIMVAKFFKAQKCVIYTDVEGIYTTDPNI